MVIITGISADAFEINGIRYPTIYQPIVGGTDFLGIYNVYDTRQRILPQTDYTEIELDGVVYGSRDLLVDALLPVIYQAFAGGGSASWGSISGILSDQTDLQTELDGKSDVGHTHTTSDITNLSVYTGFDSRYFTETEADARFAPISHTHLAIDITNLSTYSGFTSYYTKTEIQDFYDGTTAITGYNNSNWDTAFGWGDHSVEGYLTTVALNDVSDVTITGAAKGDLLVYNGTAWVDLTVGTDGHVLTADSLEATGVKWAASAGGGGGIGGSIADNQIAVGATTADDIEGSSALTWDGTSLTTTGNMVYNNASNSGILTGADTQRMLIGGGSAWSGTSGAYIEIQGLDFGGVGVGGDIKFQMPSGTEFYVSQAQRIAGNSLEIQGASPRVQLTETAVEDWYLLADAGNLDVRQTNTSTTRFRWDSSGNAIQYGTMTIGEGHANAAPLRIEGTGDWSVSNAAQCYMLGRDGTSDNFWYLGNASGGSNDILLYSYPAAEYISITSGGSFFFSGGTVNFNNSTVLASNTTVKGISRWDVSGSDTAHQRADARDDATTESRLHWFGVTDTGSTSNFRHAWYDGSAYIDVTAENGGVTWDSADSGGSTYLFTNTGTGTPDTAVTIGATGTGSAGNLTIGKGDGGAVTLAYEDNYLRWRRGGGGSIAGWRWDNFDTDAMTLSTGGTLSPRIVSLVNAAGNYVGTTSQQERDKFWVWTADSYSIGMQQSYTYGGLNDYAMTFQMSNTSSRGWWWGDTSHTNAQGSMSLTTLGILTVARGIRVGYGESDTVSMGTTYDIQVSGDIQANDYVLSSDERLKEDITVLGESFSGWDWVSYRYKNKTDRQRYGAIAQRVEDSNPEMVIVDDEGWRSLSYTDMLVKETVEQNKIIREQGDRIERLELLVQELLKDK